MIKKYYSIIIDGSDGESLEEGRYFPFKINAQKHLIKFYLQAIMHGVSVEASVVGGNHGST